MFITACVDGKFIFVIGGQNIQNHLKYRTIEKYDVWHNKWTLMDVKLNHERMQGGSVVYEDYVYVFGNWEYDTIEWFHIDDEWNDKKCE